jgi:hypothetical protein
MDRICDHPAGGTPAFYADVATGAAQIGVIIDLLRVQRSDWSLNLVYNLIRVVEEQAAEPTRLAIAMSPFPVRVELPVLQPVSDHSAFAFRYGRLLFLAFLSGRSSAWGIDLSDADFVDKIAEKVSDAIAVIARHRRVSMDMVEAILDLGVA